MLVCIGIPSIDGKPYAGTVDSLLAEQLLGYGKGVHFLVIWEIGCSLIGVARNKIAHKFINETKADVLVFVDADISWKGGEIARLAASEYDVIGGTYRAKTDEVKFHVRGDPQKVGTLYNVEGLPGGFIKISRKAFETMDATAYFDDAGRPMKDFFPVGMHEGRMWGEDYGFCRLYGEAGGQVWLDPSIKLRHHDGNRFYDGDFEAWLERIERTE